MRTPCKVSKWALQAEGDPAVTACARHRHHHGPNSPAPEMVAVVVLPPGCQRHMGPTGPGDDMPRGCGCCGGLEGAPDDQ